MFTILTAFDCIIVNDTEGKIDETTRVPVELSLEDKSLNFTVQFWIRVQYEPKWLISEKCHY